MKKIISSVEVLSQEEIVMIHNSALSILEKTGFSMPNEECLRRCEKAGAKVDYITSTVRVPKEIIENLVSKLRETKDVEYGKLSTIMGSISTQVFVNDYKTNSRRNGTSDDVMKGIALVKHLDNIPACSAATIPSDVPEYFTDVHSFHMIYKYSEKDGGTYILNPKSAKYIMDMAECMGKKTGYLFETISPLSFRKETLEMGLMFADRGHYLGIAPMIVGGTTGPMSIAGTVTLIVAEVLTSIFSVFAISGQMCNFFGHGSHTSDPKSMLCSFGSPNQALIGIAAAQMGRFYGIPSGSNSALSDALQPDFQCGFEKSFSALFSILAGTCSIGCQGIVGADQGFSFEQLVIDNEWLGAYNYVIKGAEVTEESIAEELINEIGIGGHFFAEEHTVNHLRDSWWDSKLFERLPFPSYIEKGAQSLLERAAEMVENYTTGYQTAEPAIPSDKVDALDRIYYEAKKDICGS